MFCFYYIYMNSYSKILIDNEQRYHQRYADLSSLVCQLPKNTVLYDMSRVIVDRLICSSLNSKTGIKISFDTPLNNARDLNITRPAVLRQYYGKVSEDSTQESDTSERYTYGSGSGTSSVGMDPKNFVTRPLSFEMTAMIDIIFRLLSENREHFNLTQANMDVKFNHCTVLLYYSGDDLKNVSSLGYHTDCVYLSRDGSFDNKANSQAENTPAVIYSIGDSRTLNWKKRYMHTSSSGRTKWVDTSCDKMIFELGSDTLTVINPLDERPLRRNGSIFRSQFQHGGVNVSGDKFSVGLVFRVVVPKKMYYKIDDTQLYDDSSTSGGNVVTGCLGFDFHAFHRNLSILYHNTLF